MIQGLIVVILFIGAAYYLYKSFRKQLKHGDGCGANCKCDTKVKPVKR